MTSLFIFLLLSVAALIMSILAFRLKSNPLFITASVCLGLMMLIGISNYQFVVSMFIMADAFSIVFFACLFAFPVYFLIKAKQGRTNDSFDGSEAGGAVTEEYLDEIINSPDEEIDFEDGLDLK